MKHGVMFVVCGSGIAILVIMVTVPVVFPRLRSLEVDIRTLRTTNVVPITECFVKWKCSLRNVLETILADDLIILERIFIRRLD